MKKKLVLLLLFVGFIALLAACGNNGASDASNEGDSNAGEGNKDPVTINLHHWYNEEQDNWHAVIEAFEEEHPHIKVNTITTGNNNSQENREQVDITAASGGKLDVIMLSNEADLNQRVAYGMFEPLNDYIEKVGLNMEETFLVDQSIDGVYYSLPAKYSMMFVMLNKDALDEAGLDIPKEWTWDEFMEYAAALTQGEGSNKRYGTYFEWWPFYRTLALTNHEDAGYVKPDGKTSNMDHPMFRKSLEIRERGEQEGWATPHADVIGAGLNYRTEYFNQRAAMLVTGSFMVAEAGGVPGSPSEFTTAFAPIPTSVKGDPITSGGGVETISIYSGSEHKDEAFEFIYWYTTKGIHLQGKYIPATAGTDYKDIVQRLLEDSPAPEKVDIDSLVHTLEVTNVMRPLIVPYQPELDSVVQNLTDEFLLGSEDMDTTIEKVHQRVQQVIDENN
ncbi:multiple sugar transport system substrate-binding protein [Evansella vedderi]|uniref:Multiple sugar transport system substrate-binding protein n=1 Tax=Evansella vedderi TaxID=38282 RepID=A0ABU0A0R8_9BACI|nr:extracellular solute-binding protein [Evansella vedderi]MDQ0256734.1 multiple sugar transport system substrate-binding protein [Evansella vedderi]